MRSPSGPRRLHIAYKFIDCAAANVAVLILDGGLAIQHHTENAGALNQGSNKLMDSGAHRLKLKWVRAIEQL